jgi:hypothetical protein
MLEKIIDEFWLYVHLTHAINILAAQKQSGNEIGQQLWNPRSEVEPHNFAVSWIA